MENFDLDTYKIKISKVRNYTKDMNVLIAEDYEPLHETLKKLFGALFKNVDSAYNGVEALALYNQKIKDGDSHSIIFTDIEMPNMNGIELVKKIKNIDKSSEIIVFSAYQDSKYLLELINLGVRRFILKPATLATILDELILVCDDIVLSNEKETKILLSNDITYDKQIDVLYEANKQVDLTKHEQCIIELLIQKINLAVSNKEVVEYLYANMLDVNIDNIRKIIYKLRQKLPKDFIQGVHGIGYRIVSSSDNLGT